MKIYLILFFLILFLASCDELFKPSSDDSYAIEKTLTENAMTQELTSGDDIKITVTGGTIKEETEIKVKKVSASDVPNLTLDKVTIGKNIFKIKIKGQKTFSPALKIEIKYDDEYLKSKNLTTADIKGLVHLPSGWVLGDYTIDQTNKKIIFSISSTLLPSKVKDELLDDEDEITICDGYTTTDSGQSDEDKIQFDETFTTIIWYDSYMPDKFKVTFRVTGYVQSKGIKFVKSVDSYYYGAKYLYFSCPNYDYKLDLDYEIISINTQKQEVTKDNGYYYNYWDFYPQLDETQFYNFWDFTSTGYKGDIKQFADQKISITSSHASFSGRVNLEDYTIKDKIESFISLRLVYKGKTIVKEGNMKTEDDVYDKSEFFGIIIND